MRLPVISSSDDEPALHVELAVVHPGAASFVHDGVAEDCLHPVELALTLLCQLVFEGLELRF